VTAGRSYYAGGFRVVIGGIPLRLTRKPSANFVAWMRADHREGEKEYKGRSKEDRQDYAKRRARDAREAIEQYAAALEISVNQAKARIARQRQHELANPLRDLSLEYDL
jgi:hypothetical protein